MERILGYRMVFLIRLNDNIFGITDVMSIEVVYRPLKLKIN